MKHAIDTPLPTLDFDLGMADAWHWPQPPFARRQVMSALETGEQDCRIETRGGATVQARLVHFDAANGALRIRVEAEGAVLSLPFARVLRLTLNTPWSLARNALAAPTPRVPVVAQARSYRLAGAGGAELQGQTMGHVEQPCGLFLFTPCEAGDAVLRVFVPAGAFTAMDFGKTAEEQAAERWVGTREHLLAALDAQRHVKMRPLGQALVELGLLTAGQIEHALGQQGPSRDLPLGESLVAMGLLDVADLQTALAYKMGYPVVDMARFPIDPGVTRKLPQAVMVEHSAVPLAQFGERLVVAVDSLARIPRLENLRVLSGLKLVPVLASRGSIALALGGLPQRMGTDCWADNVPPQLKAMLTVPGELH